MSATLLDSAIGAWIALVAVFVWVVVRLGASG